MIAVVASDQWSCLGFGYSARTIEHLQVHQVGVLERAVAKRFDLDLKLFHPTRILSKVEDDEVGGRSDGVCERLISWGS